MRSESPGRWENYESDAEGVDLVAAHGQVMVDFKKSHDLLRSL